MIPSLHISGFKLFRDLELPRLGSLNLFVGKNNTGKTCLLEAVELYASSSPWEILRVASRREPDAVQRKKFDRFDPFEMEESLRPLLNLFHREHGHLFKPHIRLSADDPESNLVLRCEPFIDDLLEMEAMTSESERAEPSSYRRRLGHLLGRGFEVARGMKKPRRHYFERYLHMPPPPEELIKEDGALHPDAAQVAFLPARGFSASDAKRLWDKASLADKDELLLEWLRFVEPKVLDLRYISDPESGIDLPYLKIDGDRGRTPLSSMGDGLTRLFHIGLAMANASGGILLIDEFENGLHWEVQEQLWKALFEASKHFGVQVFATTHSNDCIQAFIEAQKEPLIPSESYVYRLERKGEDIHAHEFSSQGLEAAIRQGIEVR
ncbi:MAG: AAA family ATPase [Terracidiphilus sp.]